MCKVQKANKMYKITKIIRNLLTIFDVYNSRHQEGFRNGLSTYDHLLPMKIFVDKFRIHFSKNNIS